MRYIGGKKLLLNDIETLINENTSGEERIFCDIFSGTASVARYFKSRYEVYSNDLLHFSYVIQKATVENNQNPTFAKLQSAGITDPINFLEQSDINTSFQNTDNFFITQNYSPGKTSERKYISNQNAQRIDFIRNTIESWKQNNLLDEPEYYYLLAALIEGVPYISNIAGTYGAYLKEWDKRTFKRFKMARLDILDNQKTNKSYNKDANHLITELKGDILYLDPPYNSRQYASNYHLLETISMYDNPKIKGVTGIRPYEDKKSAFCAKNEVLDVFEDLINKAKFANIILSYSTQGLMTSAQIEKILTRYATPNSYKRYSIPYRKYKSKIVKENENLQEYLFYIHKKITSPKIFPFINKPTKQKYLKSPLNYIGGKHKLLPQILPLLPKNISTFLDLFAGGCNVGINAAAQKIICNDINAKIIEMYQTFKQLDTTKILSRIEQKIAEFQLSKENEEGFIKFRNYYNKNPNPVDLYTLSCFSFNYQFRFNNKLEYNNPFGRNRSTFSLNMKNNLLAFLERVKKRDVLFVCNDFADINIDELGNHDMVYCDPPYLITTGTYNDGNRGFKDWNEKQEIALYKLLDDLHRQNVKFALSNVLVHKNIRNELLFEWSKKYFTIELDYDYSNSSYNTKREGSVEVLIVNY